MKDAKTIPATIRTVIHTYRLDTNKPLERAEHQQLLEQLKDGRHWMHAMGATSDHAHMQGGVIELETDCLFDNQWNATDNSPSFAGRRVFDHYEAIFPNRSIKIGHWLEITDEMRDIRQSVKQCGYCGALHYPPRELTFCDRCMTSEYLTPKDFPLLLLLPVSDRRDRRQVVSAEEAGELSQEYARGRLEVTAAIASRLQDKIHSDYQKKLQKASDDVLAARKTRDIRIALFEAGYQDHSNMIYYNHTDTFSFGWRSAIPDEEKVKLRAILDELVQTLCFKYEIKDPK
ncbi:MAG: hypothetical protein AB8B85_02780 [Paracoccaceae bacterium]